MSAEVNNLQVIQHPNVVKFVKFVRPNALVMEFIDGMTLTARLEEAGTELEEEEAEWVMRGLLRGLSALHEKKIIHRDIKPDNIMLRGGDHPSDCGRVVIVDLGISRQENPEKNHTQAWTFLGTVEYASPEQTVGGAPVLGIDVWAAGVVYFEMREGRRPFQRGAAPDNDQDVQLMETIRNAVVPVSPSIVESFEVFPDLDSSQIFGVPSTKPAPCLSTFLGLACRLWWPKNIRILSTCQRASTRPPM